MKQQGRWDTHRVSATAAPRALRHTPVRWRAVRPVPEPTTGVEPPSVPPHFAVDDTAWRVPIMQQRKQNSSVSFHTKFNGQFCHTKSACLLAKNRARGAAAGVELRVCRVAEQSSRCGKKSESLSTSKRGRLSGVCAQKIALGKTAKGLIPAQRNPHTTMDGVSVTATSMPLTIPCYPSSPLILLTSRKE